MMVQKTGEKLVWDAEDYSKSSPMQKKSGRELIAKLNLQGDERVLDLGCGDGLLAAEIAVLLPRGSVMGVDVSEEMIDFARKTFPPQHYPNLDWKVMDARDLTFDGEFDIVFSNAALHWVSDHLSILRGIKRSLKLGGKAFLQMGGRGSHFNFVTVAGSVIGNETWKGYFSDFSYSFGFHDPQEYEAWIRQVGLEPKRVELVARDMVLEGREGVAAWLRTTWLPFTQKIPEDKREQFIYELVDSYMQHHPPDEHDVIRVESVRLMVEAVNPA
jgi:trans-aconitate methyltransferase